MSTKHTPGPWRIGPINYADIYGSGGNVVALVSKGYDCTEANARLIAAAPDLLEALKKIRHTLTTSSRAVVTFQTLLDITTDAITKVEAA